MDFDLSIEIERPVSDVYALLADIQRTVHPGSPVPVMEKSPPGPTARGTRWREIVRLAPGIHMTVISRATLVEPDHRLAMTFRLPAMRGWLLYTLTPIPGGTRLRQEETLLFRGVLRPFAKLVGGMLGPRLQQRLEDIKGLMERPGLPDLPTTGPSAVVG